MAIGEKSRGAMVTSFLTSPVPAHTPTKEWIHNVLVTGEMRGVGGFSMMCGTLRPTITNLEELAVISNRTGQRDDGVESQAHWIAGSQGETHGLSNSLFDDPWPKVKLGQKLLFEVVEEAAKNNILEEELLEKCFSILSHDTMPAIKNDDTYETELEALTQSIYIPPFKVAPEKAIAAGTKAEKKAPTVEIEDPKIELEEPVPTRATPSKSLLLDASLSPSTKVEQVHHICTTPVDKRFPTSEEDEELWRSSPLIYGTQTQTVILVDKAGHLKYVERRLYGEDARSIDGESRDVVTEFDIEGWSA